MKSTIYALWIALATFFASNTTFSDERAVLVGRVINVVDGDTIDVQLKSGPIRLRFYAVDAPEKKQDHGKAAAAALSKLIMGKDVQIEPFKQDRYERLVGIVYLGKLNVNEELIRKGHAWAMRRYMRKADATLCEIEAEARLKQRGLWSSPKAVAPWKYRRRTKSGAQTSQASETAQSCIAAIGKPYN